MNLGPLELGLILVIVLLIFGAGKLPEVFRSMGKGIREFREAAGGADDDEKKKTNDTPDANQTAK
jgi:sec-independent protein translocase protein TatA